MNQPKVTAGRDQLGDFAPQFAALNDDVLFGQIWSRDTELSARDRSLITVTALMASGMLDSALDFHLQTARRNGITREEIVAVITHLAFYAGWPKAWAAFRMARAIWQQD
ncbi:carboxymuconolactone decarboxylase family protein [Paludibacterium sp. B53371]|uniref:carboxymuconolactone decarboxylase family protein n=1 Tax=Paludibacterium sp. B53371 TaxID=2806263 RepID=UPI001C0557AE|nr:carboxymuconolactone decarboxylase family protein [Paludibacterium sp. B53371]